MAKPNILHIKFNIFCQVPRPLVGREFGSLKREEMMGLNEWQSNAKNTKKPAGICVTK